MVTRGGSRPRRRVRPQTITIDSADTTEIDDALSVEPLPPPPGCASPPPPGTPTHRVWVHIADPTRFVPLGHPLEQEAARRGTSVYFPTGHVPMFPGPLAEGPMSLRQGEASCALTVAVDVDCDGAVVASRVFPSTIQVTYRLTYDGADELLALGLDEEKASGAMLSTCVLDCSLFLNLLRDACVGREG